MESVSLKSYGEGVDALGSHALSWQVQFLYEERSRSISRGDRKSRPTQRFSLGRLVATVLSVDDLVGYGESCAGSLFDVGLKCRRKSAWMTDPSRQPNRHSASVAATFCKVADGLIGQAMVAQVILLGALVCVYWQVTVVVGIACTSSVRAMCRAVLKGNNQRTPLASVREFLGLTRKSLSGTRPLLRAGFEIDLSWRKLSGVRAGSFKVTRALPETGWDQVGLAGDVRVAGLLVDGLQSRFYTSSSGA
ncbi:hypothetical protein BDV95DRAFT_600106 [Massariosphaeria phaeospora]|uniref:Uncharacterized protein n=1 Tax=Massariosphaeria phaeospora TaxID=100035 RepID=A0A7C8I5J0_9PLEO|nr:hypothetical protein BDV95DRAFT_600106 [Massariosphaeria phaeospora]